MACDEIEWGLYYLPLQSVVKRTSKLYAVFHRDSDRPFYLLQVTKFADKRRISAKKVQTRPIGGVAFLCNLRAWKHRFRWFSWSLEAWLASRQGWHLGAVPMLLKMADQQCISKMLPVYQLLLALVTKSDFLRVRTHGGEKLKKITWVFGKKSHYGMLKRPKYALLSTGLLKEGHDLATIFSRPFNVRKYKKRQERSRAILQFHAVELSSLYNVTNHATVQYFMVFQNEIVALQFHEIC